MKHSTSLVALAAVLAVPGLSQAQELATAVTAEMEMVVTANPLATEAAAGILARGGTATDAMIAAQTVLGLVEPQSSGMGGGAFVVYYDAATGETTTYDAREKATMAATEDRFLDENGESRGFIANWQSGLSVGVPGTPALMELMHDRHGSIDWAQLFLPAANLAFRGFALTERTSDQVAGLLARNDSCTERVFFRDPESFEYFTNGDLENCAAKPAGTTIRNADYGNLMFRLGFLRTEAGFYSGAVAEAIVAEVANDPNIPGDMTLEDLTAYEVIERAPVCQEFRGNSVCGMGPPSSGALAVGQILGILNNFDPGTAPLDPDFVHIYTQAGRLAFADRNLYVGDADFITVPVEGMLDEDYLAARAAEITDMDGTKDPGTPPGVFDPAAPDQDMTDNGTSHISIVDRFGNALSMTTTIESSFGNGAIVNGYGFLLNNELTDFSFSPTSDDGTPIANRVQAEKRPRSSMSPTIVLDAEGDVILVTGSPGGSRIIDYTAQSIVNIIDFDLDPQEAINQPHYMNRNTGDTDIEEPIPGVVIDYDVEALSTALTDTFGHNVDVQGLTSGLSIIQVLEDGTLIGGGDLRRDGAVGGQ